MNQSKTAIPFYQLESKRLIIRPWKETDFSAFKAMNSDPLVIEHFPEILSEDESRILFDEINRRTDQNGFDFWTCEVKATSDVIGFVGLNKPTDQFYFRACPQFILKQITVQARHNIDLKFLASFSKRVAMLRKCFKRAKIFSTKCRI